MNFNIMQSELVSQATVLDANRCARIINKMTGQVIERNLDPSQKWPLVYQYAEKNPKEFDIEYDKEVASPVDDEGNIRWTEEDLRRKGFPELKRIATGLSVTGRSVDELVTRILKKQNMVE